MKKLLLYLRENRLILTITAVSLLLRLIFSVGNDKSLFVDVESYDDYARVLIRDGVFAVSAYHPPVYPFFIALIYKLFGYGFIPVYIVQSAAGAFSTLLIFLIASNIFNRRIGHLSAALSLMYWPLTLYSGILLSESVFLLFLLLAVFAFLKGLDTQRPVFFAACGSALALSTLTRSINLLLPAILPIVYYFLKRKDIRLILRNSAILVICFAVLMAPWTIRNYIKYKAFIPVDTLGGVNLYIGNNEQSNGLFVDISKDPLNSQGQNDYESDKILKNAAVKYILSHPGRFVMLTLKRAAMFVTFDFAEFDWVLTTYAKENFIFCFSYWRLFSDLNLILLLMLAGLVLLILFRNRRSTKLWRGLVLLMTAVAAYFFISRITMLAWRLLGGLADSNGADAKLQEYTDQIIGMLKSGWFTLMYNSNIMFWLLGTLGIAKLVPNRKGLLILGYIVYYFMLTSAFYIQSRYRLPVIPFMAIPAAFTIEKFLLRLGLIEALVN